MSDSIANFVALLSSTWALDVGPSKVTKKAFVPMSWAFFNFVIDGS
jgi:hypothetical protein